jgi:hypothetical protein
MNPALSTELSRVFTEVLADYAFLFGDSVPAGELPGLEGQGYRASLSFRGGVTGTMAILVPESLAQEIAANTLGVAPTDPEASRRSLDALMELASVLGGHLVSAFPEGTGELLLAPPELFPMDSERWERLREDPATQCFAVNELPAMLRLELEQGGPRS